MAVSSSIVNYSDEEVVLVKICQGRFISWRYRGLDVIKQLVGRDISLTVVGHHEWWNQRTTCISLRIG